MDVAEATRKVNEHIKKVKKGQFTGYRSQQFNAIVQVLLERLEAAKAKVIWSESSDHILNELAPVYVDEEGVAQIDVDAARAAVKKQQQIWRKVDELTDLIKAGIDHELEAMNILGKMGQTALDAYEGDTQLSLEAQRRIHHALKVAKVAEANKKSTSGSPDSAPRGSGSGNAGGGGRRGRGGGNRSYGNNNNYRDYDGFDKGYDRGYDRGYGGNDNRFDRGGGRRGDDRRYGGGSGGGDPQKGNRCFLCGQTGHWSYNCPKKR